MNKRWDGLLFLYTGGIGPNLSIWSVRLGSYRALTGLDRLAVGLSQATAVRVEMGLMII